MSVRFDGVLRSWNAARGFGFIAPTHGGDDVFVHVRALPARGGRPLPNRPVSFEVERSPHGKKRATRVRWADAASAGPAPRQGRGRSRSSAAQRGTDSMVALPAFLVVYGTVALLWHVPAAVGSLYLVASAVCFIVYALDKSAAIQGRWRVPEKTLLLLGLAGGWPGAMLAQQYLRHKSGKAAFRSAFRASVIVNIAGFVAWHGPWMATWRN